MGFSFTGNCKRWVVIATICLLNVAQLIDGDSSITEPKKRRYKLIPFYDGDIRINDSNRPALIQDLLLLSHVLNNTADTVFGSKEMVRDLLTFFADLDQIMIQWLFLFLVCSSFFHMIACACIGCCACYVFKNEIRSTLKFAKRQTKLPNKSPGADDAIGEKASSPKILPGKTMESWSTRNQNYGFGKEEKLRL
uniref:Reticulon domain-containing protein n=1 Tax=Setaria digitata TaxID=48799 RepID=A0A915PVU5_9BILA